MLNRKSLARLTFGLLILTLAATGCSNFPPRRATETPQPTDTPLAPAAQPTSTPTPVSEPTDTQTPVVIVALTPSPTLETPEAPETQEPEGESDPTATPQAQATPTSAPPPPTPTPQPTELLTNGNFEEGFGADGVADGWSRFSNDKAGFGWEPDQWDAVVLEGEHSQLMFIQSPSLNDRYVGIYQTVDVAANQAYELTLNGLVRANTPSEDYGHRLYWAVDYDGGTDWQAVENWEELPWNQQPLVADDLTFNNYTTVITATGQSLTLFIRGHSKWPRNSDADFNLDNLSLRGVPGAGAEATMPVTGGREFNWMPIVALIVLLLIFFREAWRGMLEGPEEA
jgi:hypothetical protein